MYYLGIMGEMRETKYVLINEKFECILEEIRETTHLYSIGEDNLKLELLLSVNHMIEKAGIKRSELKFIFLGLQGYGESEDDKLIIERAVFEALGEFNYKIDNDSVAAFAAGTLCNVGMNIISGTGSIVFGMNKEGLFERAGGWGPIIGDDGSLQWVGIRTVNEYTKQKDGRSEKTILVDILEREKDIQDYYGIVELIFNKYNLSMTELTKLSRISIMAAKEGCPACRRIFKDAAFEIFLLVKALKERLDIDYEFILSYSGGIFFADEFVLEPLKELLEKAKIKCNLKRSSIKSSYGASLMAYKLAEGDIPEGVEIKIKN